ncbi:MAG: hypothetical protein ACFFDK_17710, partial [Promethearchaeota archaeon]
APEKPENLIELIEALLDEPSSKNGQAFYEAVKSFRKWRMRGFANVQFMLDTELAWVEGKPYIGDI